MVPVGGVTMIMIIRLIAPGVERGVDTEGRWADVSLAHMSVGAHSVCVVLMLLYCTLLP